MHGVVVKSQRSRAAANSDELVDAVLGASRALVAVAARSLATVADDVTLAQYRVLIELASRGPQRLADLAGLLRVDRSPPPRGGPGGRAAGGGVRGAARPPATRWGARPARKPLVARRRTSEDRRG